MRWGRSGCEGGSRAIGYWQQAERTAAAFRGEWYVTGDLVSRDASGYFTYAGRGDDMLKVAGKWVAPAEVEDCLLGHAAVKECAVVGVTDAQRAGQAVGVRGASRRGRTPVLPWPRS